MCAHVPTHAYEQRGTDAFEHVHRMCRQTHRGTLKKKSNANASESCLWDAYMYICSSTIFTVSFSSKPNFNSFFRNIYSFTVALKSEYTIALEKHVEVQ